MEAVERRRAMEALVPCRGMEATGRWKEGVDPSSDATERTHEIVSSLHEGNKLAASRGQYRKEKSHGRRREG